MILEDIMQVSTAGIETAMFVSAPVLVCGLVAGVLVSVFQAATQINDSSLAFVPKIVAVMAAMMIFGPWMISKMTAFTTFAFNQIPNVTF